MLRMDAIIAQDPGPEVEFEDRFDFRFVIEQNPEPSSNADLHFVTRIATYYGDDMGVIESFTSEDPGAAVEAAREAQMYSLEERWEMEAEREQQERAAWGNR